MRYIRSIHIVFLFCLPVLLAGCHRGVTSAQNTLRRPAAPAVDYRATLLKIAGDTVNPRPPFSPEHKLPPHECQFDIAVLKKAMETVQPGIYRFSTKAQMDSVFQLAEKASRDSLTYTDMVRIVAPVISQVRCVHSTWGHSEQYMDYRRKNIPLMPLDISVVGGGVYVRRDLSLEKSIAPGSRIVSINGTPAGSVLHTLKGFLETDGTVESFRPTRVGHFFPRLYVSLIAHPDKFRLEVIPPNGSRPVSYTVRSLKLDVLDSVRRTRYCLPQSDAKPLEFRYIDSGKVAVYTIRSFAQEEIKEHGQKFVAFTDSVFALLQRRNTKDLIIDIRDNSGGWTAYGRYLFSYFIEKPIPMFDNILIRQQGGYFFEPIMTKSPGYNNTMSLVKRPDGLMEWKDNMNLSVRPALWNRFGGDITILMNGQSLSCASLFATLMLEHTKAVFVGEESGGASCGPSSMAVTFSLPYSKISVTLSTAQYNLAIADKANSRGAMPHHVVQPTIHDIIKEDDVVLKAALRIIHQK